MRGYDRVKIEKVEGDEDGDVEIEVQDRYGEFTEIVEAGKWLEGDDWSVLTGFDTKVWGSTERGRGSVRSSSVS